MSDKESFSGMRLSRRGFLYSAAGGGAVLGTTLIVFPAIASAKASQQSAQYRPTPNGKAQCSNCSQFQPPSSCKLVDGTISPAGWCTLYKAKG